ncbi:energy-coupling factor transport system substrate-specific component [Streptoalloteichus tenebrarius]|uniref:Energy-coupling factor transport system substrate-specific component n=1 Tax=Streptoalloteichus tenebrarius (strain ATCC 17920 / DSM 40477 / JCM 4838 / CBS 697.72 / NBRC 16177 / NCIMB 11028 / NRRL B-12390 / A12253. 1 / ISP 5477) TaxID=1933 RepID=A0ABT1I084_STRSD|nr:ECF transporter S component [Streptoalloteichus tenebrarius]MCP2261193.1 energy-coupling factor transport system substrate-specific component [Streptoalloteichus tenebrarius]BFF02948.1 ECF transporter S component [Streptoalloteichus tenebrarius]
MTGDVVVHSGRTPSLPRLGPRAAVALVLASVVGLVGFGWPFVVRAESRVAHEQDAPWLFAALTVLVLAVVLAALLDGAADAKTVALLGVLSAVGAALRPFGAGAAGIEPMFVVFVLGGRVLGPAGGFALGSTAMLASALLTAGIGPWLPFQMLTASWIGLGAGLLPRRPAGGRGEVLLLAGYAIVAGLGYGAVMNLWFWPVTVDPMTPIGYAAGEGPLANLRRYATFYLATSLGWDVPRALLNAGLVLLAGSRVLTAMRRAVRRAAFDTPVTVVRPTGRADDRDPT